MTDLDLCYASATNVLKRFRDGSLSPVEYLSALIARAEETEPKVNAFAATHFDKAMEQAKRAEARYAAKASDLRVLEDLPIAIKDEVNLEGEIVMQGSLYYKDTVAAETHYTFARLFEAGAFYHAQTTTPEFCCAAVTDSRIHGTTRTPWGLDYTCGGSSGGSGASLAVGSSPLAKGSDIGGSIRIPAACCGVVGYKTPCGRNPDNTAFAYDMYAVVGPMGRSVADVTMMQNIMCGPHPLDNASIRPKYDLPMSHGSLSGKKITWSMDFGNFEVDERVRKNTLKTLDMLQDLGAELVAVNPGWSAEADRSVAVYLDHLFDGYMASVVATDPGLASNWAQYCVDANQKTTSTEFYAAYQMQADMALAFGPILEEYYVFICPTLGHHEIPADQYRWDDVRIIGRVVDPMDGWSLCHPFNMFGRCPVLSVPSGLGSNGLPTGTQIISGHLDDARVFHVGQALEDAAPWLMDAETRPPI